MIDHNRHKYSKLPDLIGDLKAHDHLCLIYESREEWLEAVVPFILSGLEHGEKCIYVVDANTAREIKAILKEAGLAVDEAEAKGQLSIIHERDTYTRGGFFDPDLMIGLLRSETEKALQESYSALRVTSEMSWALRDYSGAERVLEYEAKLNKDLFPAYPCVALCQYDRWKFNPDTIKGVVLTHPLLIRGGQVYRNFYYIEPDEYLNHKKGEREVQHWLNNLERERLTQESLRESEVFTKTVLDNLPIGLAVNSVDPEVNFTYMNDNFPQIYHTTREALAEWDAFWEVIYEDPHFRSQIKKRVLDDCASGDPEKMLWENVSITRNGQVVAYISASNTPVPGKNLMISTVWDVTDRVKAEQTLQESEERARHQRMAIVELFLNDAIYAGEIEPASKVITRVLGNSVKIERVSIWVIDDNHDELQCLNLYEHSSGKHSRGEVLKINTFPKYFTALLKDSRISAVKAQEDPRTSELSERHLKPLGITSLLDAGIVVDGKLKGVVSFEHVGEQRTWHVDEEAFVSTIASMVGQLMTNVERKKAEEEIRILNEELEHRVKERTVQLEAANKELEAFAYSVSHDLRAPLRALEGFSANLENNYADHLDEQGMHYLNRIRKASLHMSDLINDLLQLSRITRAVIKDQKVDLSNLAGDVIQKMQQTEPERRVTVEIAPGLTARGDARLLQVVLENLLSNAWKFSSKNPQARIEIGLTRVNDEEVFFVRDNGAGFDIAYAGKLFGPFQRLHGVNEFPGTGVGLATVQRIINRHGGKIWAEGEVGQGATFYFSLGRVKT